MVLSFHLRNIKGKMGGLSYILVCACQSSPPIIYTFARRLSNAAH